MLEVSQQRRGQRVGGKQTLVQLRRRGVGDHGPTYPHGVAVGGAHRDRPSAFHVDGTDGALAVDLRAGGGGAVYERGRQLARTAYRDREAAILGHHDQQIAHDAAAWRVDRHVGVHGVAQQQ